MSLRQIFIRNLKEFRKRENLSQMKLSECCNASIGYISEIEMGRKFPSVEMIDKIAEVLRIEPYRLFKEYWTQPEDSKDTCPFMASYVRNEIKSRIKKQMESSLDEINGIIDRY